MNKQEAAKELLRRRYARRGLIDFTRYTFPQYRPADHHYLIADKLYQIQNGEIKRLMIFMPPRHGKSELASRRFPAFTLGLDSDKQFISASYNSELATDFGREVRNIIRSQEYRALFPETSIAGDSGAADRWHTTARGGYVAAGVGTAITGRGAHILSIDDPVKDREEAESEIKRKRVYDWYTSTAYTRLESTITEDIEEDILWDVPGALKDGLIEPFEGAVVLIMTRWHDDDLAGRLLDDMEHGGDIWEVLELPALSHNKALWPAKYPKERLIEIKSAIGPRDFSALYQQQPQPDEGTFFKREWFKRYNVLPEFMNIYSTQDYAVTEGKTADFTEDTVWGIDPENNIYLLANWHGQTSADVWIDEHIELIRQWEPLCCFGEGGVIRRAVEPFLRKAMEEKDIWARHEWINPVHDKPTRARSFQAMAATGKVFLPEGDVGDRAIDQLIRFPAGKYDDFVDTCSTIGLVIDKAHEAFIPPKPPETDWEKEKTFNDVLNEMDAPHDRW